MTTYLVTGGAGFIGSSIAEKLLDAGETVRILDDFSTGRRQNIDALKAHKNGSKLEVIEGSIVDPAAVSKAVKGVEVVFHEAAIPSVARSVENPQASMLANVQGTTTVLDLAQRAGVKRFIFAASSSRPFLIASKRRSKSGLRRRRGSRGGGWNGGYSRPLSSAS